MSRIAATRRSALPALALAAVLVTAALVGSGLQSIPVRTYTLRVPDSGTTGIARPAHRLCEGPIRTPSPASGVEVFTKPAGGTATLEVTVVAGGRVIAAGSRVPNLAGFEQHVDLDRAIPTGRAVQVCVGASDGALAVLGAGAQTPGVGTHGVVPGMQFALVLTRSGTLLGSLSRAFSRAAIFRPSWVGAWTFWALLALLGCTLPLAGVALVRALAAAEPDEN